MTSTAQAQYAGAQPRQSLTFIIGASSVGTLIEWYDFYLYGVLAVFFARHFSPSGDDNLALLASLAVFWFGFLLRPFGAIFFGHLGDLIGRKFTSMRTLLLMGAATFVAWLQPDRRPGADLAGGDARAAGPGARGLIWRAATYVAEHAPNGKRGLFTSWVQIFASAFGTVFEWHDFIFYATLAPRCREATKP